MSENRPGAPKDSEGNHVYHDFDDDTALTSTILELIDQLSDEDDPELNGSLNDYVDPDALNALFQPRFDGTPREGSGQVSLSVFGFDIVVHSDGHVVVYEPEA